MEIQLQELIDQIKKDGVEAAEDKAELILGAAREEADRIIENAKAEAEKMLKEAKAESERAARSGEEAIRQAGRNVLISFRESIARELNAIINRNVSEVYSSDTFAQLIVKTVEEWTRNSEAENISVLLNSKDLQALEEAVLAALKEKMLGGVTLRANDNFDGGFRIEVKDNSAYYDYSAEAVSDMLSAYLSPKVAALLKEAESV